MPTAAGPSAVAPSPPALISRPPRGTVLLSKQAQVTMLKDPRRERSLRSVLPPTLERALSSRRRAAEPLVEKAPPAADALCEQPLIIRHENTALARHQEAFIATAKRHELRAAALRSRGRHELARLHHRTAGLLLAYAQPGEIERLPLVGRPGPAGTPRGAHPAMVAFAEGAAEEFLRIYSDESIFAGAESNNAGTSLLRVFHRTNFHRIYLARLAELEALIREGRLSPLAEATLMRRYGPHDI